MVDVKNRASSLVLVVKIGTNTVDLLEAERIEIYKAKSTEDRITDHFRENTTTKCNDDGTMKIEEGRTVRLVPDISPWIARKFGEVI